MWFNLDAALCGCRHGVSLSPAYVHAACRFVQAHEDAFQEMKKYYNDITRANLELISQLKAQVAQANEKQAANQKLMLEIAEENKKLSDPLQRAQEELKSLQSDLRDADKDRQSLRYAKTRLTVGTRASRTIFLTRTSWSCIVLYSHRR
jgi:cell shape-determining protein MreC